MTSRAALIIQQERATMWAAFKQGYYEAGGIGVVSLFGIILGNVFKGMCWGVGLGIAFRLMGLL